MAKIPVFLTATASKLIGYVEVDNAKDYMEKAHELWEETGENIMGNISNDFEVGESDIGKMNEDDIKYYMEQEDND